MPLRRIRLSKPFAILLTLLLISVSIVFPLFDFIFDGFLKTSSPYSFYPTSKSKEVKNSSVSFDHGTNFEHVRVKADRYWRREVFVEDESIPHRCKMDAAIHEQKTKRIEVKSFPSNDNLANVITVNSVEDNMLSHLGGTGHWYHLLEKVLPSLSYCYRHVWGPMAKLDRNVCPRRPSEAIGVSGAKIGAEPSYEYDESRGCYPDIRAEEIIKSDIDLYIVFREESSVRNLLPFTRFVLVSILTGGRYNRVHFSFRKDKNQGIERLSQHVFIYDVVVCFTVDVKNQTKEELFVVSSNPNHESTSKGYKSDMRKESESVNLCGTLLYHVPLRASWIKSDWLPKVSSIYEFWDSYHGLCGLKESLDRQNIFRGNETVPYALAFKRAHAKPNDDSDSKVDASATIQVFDDAHVGVKPSHLKMDPLFSLPFTPPIESRVRKNRTLRMLVYQRDIGRRFLNMEKVIDKLKWYLERRGDIGGPQNNSIARRVPADWKIELLIHSDQRPPCRLIEIIKDSSAILTPHGFQSVLLFYQPSESLLAEVHPNSMFIPYYYGEFQVSLRQKFGLARSYLADESSATNWLLAALRGSGLLNNVTCSQLKFCRHISKAQNIRASEAFLKRVAFFLRSYFLYE